MFLGLQAFQESLKTAKKPLKMTPDRLQEPVKKTAFLAAASNAYSNTATARNAYNNSATASNAYSNTCVARSLLMSFVVGSCLVDMADNEWFIIVGGLGWEKKTHGIENHCSGTTWTQLGGVPVTSFKML